VTFVCSVLYKYSYLLTYLFTVLLRLINCCCISIIFSLIFIITIIGNHFCCAHSKSDLTLRQFRRALKTYLFGSLRLQHLVTFVCSVLNKSSYLLTYLLAYLLTYTPTVLCADFFDEECTEDAEDACKEFLVDVPLSEKFDPEAFAEFCR